jgi:hypothetical protein
MPQRGQKTHEAFHRITAEPASQHSRYLRLIDAHELRRSRLGQPSLPDNTIDPNYQPRLDRVFPASATPMSANALPVLTSRLGASFFGIL